MQEIERRELGDILCSRGFCLPGCSAKGTWSSATKSYPAESSAGTRSTEREGGEETINITAMANNMHDMPKCYASVFID